MNPNIVKCNVPLRTDSARPGRSVKTSSQPSCSSCMTHGAQPVRSARLSSDQLGPVQSNMQDGECGDSRRTRAYPAGDREHRHQLYRTDPPVSTTLPPGGCPPRGAPRWRQLNGRRQPAEGARLASASNSCEPAQNFNGRVSIIGQLAG